MRSWTEGGATSFAWIPHSAAHIESGRVCKHLVVSSSGRWRQIFVWIPCVAIIVVYSINVNLKNFQHTNSVAHTFFVGCWEPHDDVVVARFNLLGWMFVLESGCVIVLGCAALFVCWRTSWISNSNLLLKINLQMIHSYTGCGLGCVCEIESYYKF